MKRLFTLFIVCVLTVSSSCKVNAREEIVPGASRSKLYLPHLLGKKVGLVVNHTAMADTVHLVDFLIGQGVDVRKIFVPEHGFRGNADAGEYVSDMVDKTSGLPIISLYGKNKKPSKEQLLGIDVLVFDIQDVGCRFFTYISTMLYVMEACADNNLPLIILDRPNPNGDYIDGPVLNPTLKSFVGLLPIPIVHGCTVGELALMIAGEQWYESKSSISLTVIPVDNYTHSMTYNLPIKPSPNLPNHISVRLYPSLCLFEATNISIGRGTLFPFQVIGYPDKNVGKFEFTPVSIEGMSKNPLHENKKCYGDDLRNLQELPRFTISFFLEWFSKFDNKNDFWKSKEWIGLLMGDPAFFDQVNSGLDEETIRETWKPGIDQYKNIRKKYLLYPDFSDN
jgi:uncharacterized protein YbbC (DUF1343 family)